MDLLSYVAQTTCQQEFYLGMDIFHIIFEDECAAFDFGHYLLKPGRQNREFSGCQKSY